MVNYFRNEKMVYGGEFRCFNCNNLLVSKIMGSNYELNLQCSRCSADILIKMRELMGKEAVEYFKKKKE
mgnify:FL=1